MIPWLTEGVIVLHHNGVSLLSMASSCGVAREKGPFGSHLDECTDTLCLFPENSTSFGYFLDVKMFANFVLSHVL